MSNTTNLTDLVVDSLTINGVSVVTALLLASGQSADLNGEAGGLILDAAAVVVLQGATAGHGKLVVSGSTVVDVSAAATALTGTLSVSGALTASAAATVGTTLGVTGITTATGGVKNGLFAAVTGDGAISIVNADKTFYITKAGVAAMTLADPTATTHDGLTYCFISATAQAHTLSNAAGSGFNAGGSGTDVGTFGGAIGDNIVITAYQGKWLVVSKVNVVLG